MSNARKFISDTQRNDTYHVYVGGKYFGEIVTRSLKHGEDLIKQRIEELAPLNSSPEGAEKYRDRYRGLPITFQPKYK